MRKKIPFYFFIFLILISNFKIALSGTTGKISGRVTNSETGDPIPGVSVVIQGTTMGAATNFEGYYVINNVPPGTYTLIVSAIGFQKQQFNNVKVSTDFTTKLNAQLVPEAVAMGTVIVEAQAPLIRTDLTSSHTTVDAATIEALPIEGISQVLTLQAGIIQGSGGELHIRGGRSNEIAYSVNGVSISNPFDNTV
ncbi:MAG: TonB-dependent receptor, partial [Ignavibacteria bacterium]|nr:TonB-dependent receptor [Ignavibacteria bacterium]